jgi:hypothetical protein
METNPLNKLSVSQLQELLSAKQQAYQDAIHSGKVFYDTKRMLSEIRELERQLRIRNDKMFKSS